MIKKNGNIFAALAASAALIGAGGVGVLATTTAAVAEETTDEASSEASGETSGETVLASGTWTKKFAKSRGEWSIVERDGARYVVLSDDFRTRGAPDLKIFLTPKSVSAVNGGNATDGSVLIAPLTSNRGGQEYEIPEGVDLSSYASIVIHCEAYSKLWSAASLA